MYEAHKPAAELAAGLAAGRYHQGTLRVNRFNPFEGWVSCDSVGKDILISGRIDMNRALDGDVVVVELLPEEEWKGPSSFLPGAKTTPSSSSGTAASPGDSPSDASGEDAESAAGARIFQVAPDSNAEDLAALEGRRPTGRVVGVMKRNWRERGYCGSLKPGDVPAGNQTVSVLFVPVERRLPMIR
jgi:exosome complex exonuclease DIS3/RRP44